MASTIEISMDRRDAAALFDQLERARKELGKSLGQAVRFAAWSLATSLGAATKIAPKHREVEAVPLNRADWGQVREYEAGRKEWKIKDYRWGAPRLFKVTARTKTEAKQSRRGTIRHAGLAKQAWMFNVKKLGKPLHAQGFIAALAKKKADTLAKVDQNLKGDNPHVKLFSRVRYAEAALKGGASSINGAFGKAARMMAIIIDKDIQKKMGAK